MPNGIRKWVMSDTMAYRWILKYWISFLSFIVSELQKFQMSGCFIDAFISFQKFGIPCQVNSGFSVMIFCPIQVFLWHMESCLEDRVESVCFSLWGSPNVNDVFEVLKLLKWEFTSEWQRQQNIGHSPFLSQAKSFWLYDFLAISIWNVFVKWIIMILFDTF